MSFARSRKHPIECARIESAVRIISARWNTMTAAGKPWMTSDAGTFQRTVRHFVDTHAQARGQVPPIAVALPAALRLRALSVRPPPLSDYQHLTAEHADDHDDTDA